MLRRAVDQGPHIPGASDGDVCLGAEQMTGFSGEGLAVFGCL